MAVIGRKGKDKIATATFFVSALLSSLVVFGILIILVAYGLKTFSNVNIFDFLFGIDWNPDAYGKPSYGIVPLFVGSLIITLIAMIIAVPMGVSSALFLSEQVKGKWRGFFKTVVELFAGIPSVIIGFVGLVVVAPFISRVFGVSSGIGVLNAGITLAMMSLPTIISVAEDSFKAVPSSYRQAAYGLGATEWQTAVKVVLPSAKSGVVAAVMLGFGRAIGETMAVLMVAGNSPIIPKSLFDPVRTITSTIAIELGEVPFGTTHFYSLFALGLILFLISVLTNITAEAMINREKKRLGI